jgi:hypothetical protein
MALPVLGSRRRGRAPSAPNTDGDDQPQESEAPDVTARNSYGPWAKLQIGEQFEV